MILKTMRGQDASLNSAEQLELYINACAGATARWLQRHDDGSGKFITATKDEGVIAANDFPDFFIRHTGHDEFHTQLLQAFFN